MAGEVDVENREKEPPPRGEVDQRIDRHSRPSHEVVRSVITHAGVFSIYNKIYKSPFITDFYYGHTVVRVRYRDQNTNRKAHGARHSGYM